MAYSPFLRRELKLAQGPGTAPAHPVPTGVARPAAEMRAQLAEIADETAELPDWQAITDPAVRQSCQGVAAYYAGASRTLRWALGERPDSPILGLPALDADVLAQELRAARPSADDERENPAGLQPEYVRAVWRTLRWISDDGSSNQDLPEPVELR